MIITATALAAAMLSSPGAEDPGASYGGGSGHPCDCTREATFYTPWRPRPPITVQAPGIRVVGRPVYVEGPSIRVQGPPVWVEAPPVHVAPAHIYIERPDVRVRPSEITIEPPVVHFQDCKDVGPIGTAPGTCPPGSGGGYQSGGSSGGYAPSGTAPSYPAGAAPARGGSGRYE